MSDSSPYHLPEFILDELKSVSSLTESDMEAFDNIYLQSGQFTYPDARTNDNWMLVKQKIQSTNPHPELHIVRNNRNPFYIKWAAAAMIVLSISIGLFQYYKTSHTTQPLAIITAEHLQKITLPDGSVVTLNTFSSLSSDNYNADERSVELKGEAFFDVVHSDKPFTVNTGAGKIRVFGTKFNVKNRSQLPFQVALSSGKVSFETAKGNYILKPGDVITQTSDGQVSLTRTNSSTLCWLDEKLVFENETLGNIITTLESQYNVKLEYDPKLRSEKLTLTFNKLTAHQAAELLSKTLNSKVVVK